MRLGDDAGSTQRGDGRVSDSPSGRHRYARQSESPRSATASAITKARYVLYAAAPLAGLVTILIWGSPEVSTAFGPALTDWLRAIAPLAFLVLMPTALVVLAVTGATPRARYLAVGGLFAFSLTLVAFIAFVVWAIDRFNDWEF